MPLRAAKEYLLYEVLAIAGFFEQYPLNLLVASDIYTTPLDAVFWFSWFEVDLQASTTDFAELVESHIG